MTNNSPPKVDLLFPPDAPKRCTLTVDNFLTLRDVFCEFRGMNVIIGPQAEGKSLLSKLLYFFCTVFAVELYFGATDKKEFKAVKKSSELLFKRIFPAYAWDETSFLINFSIENYSITIEHKEGLNIIFSDSIIKDYKKIKHEFVEDEDIKNGMFCLLPSMYKIISTYIPDSRILFSKVLQNNIFNLIANSDKKERPLNIDILLQKFSAKIERLRSKFSETENFDSEAYPTARNVTDAQFTPILKGAYRIIGGNDYIVSDGKKTLLEHASSGQQVATPMLLAVSNEINQCGYSFICLEEPEAHLFPTAQKQVMEHIVAAYNTNDKEDIFCITTHSPYLLSTLNNCITAAEVLKTRNRNKIRKVERILPKQYWISFDDVSCYYLEGGKVINLMDQNTRLITTNAIDGVSKKLNDDFSNILDALD